MNVLDTLKKEHRLVRRYIDIMEVVYDLLKEGKEVPKDVFGHFLEFSKTFLDTYHHFKEEYVLFLKLAEKKGGAIDPQIMSLRDQHESGRKFINKIKKSITGYIDKDESATATLYENLGYFNLLQKQHLARENHVFYPMARDTFSDEEMKQFEEEFEKDEKNLGKNVYANSEQLVEQIVTLLKGKFGAQYRDRLEAKQDGHAHSS